MNDDTHDDWSSYQHERKKVFIIHEIERLQFLSDTNRILKIQFGKRSTFGDMMYIVNLARIYKFDRYILMNESFYFIANPPIDRSSLDTDDPDEEEEYRQYQPLTHWELFMGNVEEKCWALSDKKNENPILIYGFVVLIFIPALINLFWKLKKFRQSKSFPY